jgi:triosephosphate isomerase
MPYVIGNWKMNGGRDLLASFGNLDGDKIALCVPFHLLGEKTMFPLGAEDCSAHDSGAFTGEVSAKMIAETGAKYCIVGHSERRLYHNETNEIVAAKASRCLENGLIPIICVGETKEQKENGETLKIIEDQVWQSVPDAKTVKSEIIVAYEPAWAIGTGLIPSADEIQIVHNHIAKNLDAIGLPGTAILYGGSVKSSNAAEIMALSNVGGVLVGGASLDAEQFGEIINAGK